MKDKKINVTAKKTESEWIKGFDKFFLEATPKFFEWLGWVTVLAAITYLSRKEPSVYLSILKVIGYWLLLGYFQAYFYRLKFIFNKGWSKKVKHLTATIFSFVLCLVTFSLAHNVLYILASNAP